MQADAAQEFARSLAPVIQALRSSGVTTLRAISAALNQQGVRSPRSAQWYSSGYAMSLNLTIWIGTETEQFMKSIGRELPKYQGNESWTLPILVTFVVVRDGRIKARFVDPDDRHRMAIDPARGPGLIFY